MTEDVIDYPPPPVIDHARPVIDHGERKEDEVHRRLMTVIDYDEPCNRLQPDAREGAPGGAPLPPRHQQGIYRRPIDITDAQLDALEERGYLDPDRRGDRADESEAVEMFLMDALIER